MFVYLGDFSVHRTLTDIHTVSLFLNVFPLQVHLSDVEGMGVFAQLLVSSSLEQFRTPPPSPRVSPKPAPPVRKFTPILVVRGSARAPPSPEPHEWRTIGQGGKVIIGS